MVMAVAVPEVENQALKRKIKRKIRRRILAVLARIEVMAVAVAVVVVVAQGQVHHQGMASQSPEKLSLHAQLILTILVTYHGLMGKGILIGEECLPV